MAEWRRLHGLREREAEQKGKLSLKEWLLAPEPRFEDGLPLVPRKELFRGPRSADLDD